MACCEIKRNHRSEKGEEQELMMRQQNKSAFTLVELFIVIAIIAILAGLLLPALTRAKAATQSAACLGNLRQLCYGWRLYADDNGDRLAGSISVRRVNQPGSWVLGNTQLDQSPSNIMAGVMSSYAASGLYHCPADRSKVSGRKTLPRVRSYTMSGWMNSSSDDPAHPGESYPRDFQSMPHTLSQILRPPPEGTFVFIEEQEDSIDDGLWNSDPYALAAPGIPMLVSGASPVWYNLPADRHNQGANIAFADGNVSHHKWLWPKRNWNPNTTLRPESGSSDQLDLIYTLQICPVAGK
jgi:prepilin-type processing-associated H-X9-DG protein/prepilin-type N-terminal cleavage/methylation domain-containing protein